MEDAGAVLRAACLLRVAVLAVQRERQVCLGEAQAERHQGDPAGQGECLADARLMPAMLLLLLLMVAVVHQQLAVPRDEHVACLVAAAASQGQGLQAAARDARW